MHPYLLVPLIAALGCAATAGILFTQGRHQRANLLVGRLLVACTFWAICEVIWNTHSNAEAALWWARLSALGWVWIGPVVLHLFLDLSRHRESTGLRNLTMAQYGGALGFALASSFTPWVITTLEPVAWGYSPQFGPGFALFYGFTMLNLGIGAFLSTGAVRRDVSRAEAAQARWLMWGAAAPSLTVSLTDVLLPLAGLHPPRLGTLSFAFFGAVLVRNLLRHGFSVAAPGAYAREILSTLREGVALLHMSGHVRSCNDALADLAGTTRSALDGCSIRELIPDETIHWGEEIRDAECELRTRDGRRIPVSIGASLLRDKRGELLGIVLVIRDITELVGLRTRLITSGRLAAVGELAAGIAHEINNPMAFIRANLSLLQTHWKQVTDAVEAPTRRQELEEVFRDGDEMIQECLEGVERAAAFVREIKGFSHAGTGQRELADVNFLLDSAARVAGPQLRKYAVLEKRYADVPQIWCAPQQLKQVFLNLLVNAAQAVGDRGRITISTEPYQDEVIVRVADDGPGIAPEHLDRIFDPFFTTKSVGEGTGLGLAISFQIVRRHGGDIRVESASGHGSCFRVHLPIGQPDEPEASERPAS